LQGAAGRVRDVLRARADAYEADLRALDADIESGRSCAAAWDAMLSFFANATGCAQLACKPA
jgi:hypothetical protein